MLRRRREPVKPPAPYEVVRIAGHVAVPRPAVRGRLWVGIGVTAAPMAIRPAIVALAGVQAQIGVVARAAVTIETRAAVPVSAAVAATGRAGVGVRVAGAGMVGLSPARRAALRQVQRAEEDRLIGDDITTEDTE